MSGQITDIIRTYPDDRVWILKHRGTGTSADVISRLIKFYEDVERLTKGGMGQ